MRWVCGIDDRPVAGAMSHACLGAPDRISSRRDAAASASTSSGSFVIEAPQQVPMSISVTEGGRAVGSRGDDGCAGGQRAGLHMIPCGSGQRVMFRNNSADTQRCIKIAKQ